MRSTDRRIVDNAFDEWCWRPQVYVHEQMVETVSNY